MTIRRNGTNRPRPPIDREPKDRHEAYLLGYRNSARDIAAWLELAAEEDERKRNHRAAAFRRRLIQDLRKGAHLQAARARRERNGS